MDANLVFGILQTLVTTLALVGSLTMVVIITIWTNIYAKVFYTAGKVWAVLHYEIAISYPEGLNEINKARSTPDKLKIMRELLRDDISKLLIDDFGSLTKTRWAKYLWFAITTVFCWLILVLICILIYMVRIGLGSQVSGSLIILFVVLSVIGLGAIATTVASFFFLRHKTDNLFITMGIASQHLNQYRAKKK